MVPRDESKFLGQHARHEVREPFQERELRVLAVQHQLDVGQGIHKGPPLAHQVDSKGLVGSVLVLLLAEEEIHILEEAQAHPNKRKPAPL